MTVMEITAWSLSKALQAALTGRLLQTQRAYRYRAFTAFLIVSLLRSLALATYGSQSLEHYVAVWNWSTAPLLLTLSLAVYEVHRKVIAHCAPVRFPRVITAIMIAVAIVTCLLTMESVTWRSSVTAAYTATRIVAGTLAIWLFCHAAFFYKIEPPVPESLMAHGYILTIYLVAEAGAYAAINVLAPYAPLVVLNVISMSVNGALYVAWLIAFWRKD